MPSGGTHDRITLWSLPVVAGLGYAQTQNGNLTLLLAGGFLFGGLMFGPDLDIYSRQYQRWGPLRWIWIPYQKSLRHRSFFSHGPIVGTVLRSLYLLTWIALFAWLTLFVAQAIWDVVWDEEEILLWAIASSKQHYPELIATFIGLEMGAMSHSLSDWGGSFYKQIKSGKMFSPNKGKHLKRRVVKKRSPKTQKTPK
jgi:uncharacterized metal-binding protein